MGLSTKTANTGVEYEGPVGHPGGSIWWAVRAQRSQEVICQRFEKYQKILVETAGGIELAYVSIQSEKIILRWKPWEQSNLGVLI